MEKTLPINKPVKNVEEFKAGGYYSFRYYSPMGSSSDLHHFFVTDISKGVMTNMNAATATEEMGPLENFARCMRPNGGFNYYHSNKNAFVEEFQSCISKKEREGMRLLTEADGLKHYVKTLP